MVDPVHDRVWILKILVLIRLVRRSNSNLSNKSKGLLNFIDLIKALSLTTGH